MGNRIIIKNSSTASAEPLTTDLELGELAINSYDGKLFLKKNDGADAIVEIGGAGGAFTEDAGNNLVGGTGAGAALVGTDLQNFIAGYNAGGAAHPDYAVIVGFNAGYYSDSLRSVTIGYGAGFGASANRISGDDNVSIGYDALRNATTAYNTTAVGANALKGTGTTPLTGVFNCGFGYNTGQNIQGTASRNALIGSYAGSAVTTGSFNTFVGVQAGNLVQTGSSNTIVGQNAGSGLGTGAASNVIIGRQAGPTTNVSNELYIHNAQSDTPLIHGDFSASELTVNGDLFATGGVDKLATATGVVSVAAATAPTVGQILTATSATVATWQDPADGLFTEDGSFNIVGGTNAGAALTSGTDNFLAGYLAGQDLNSGGDNVYVGNSAGLEATTGSQNTAVGYQALSGIATAAFTGTSNVAVGWQALGKLNGSTGSNVAAGVQAGVNITSGGSNTLLGFGTGVNIVNQSNNVCIGNQAGPTTNVGNQLFIDVTTTDTPLIHGNFSSNVVTINGGLLATGGVDKLTTATTAVSVAAATAPTAGQKLTATSSTAATWQDDPWETYEAVTYAATLAIDFDDSATQYISATGDLTTLTTANRAAGKKMDVCVLASAADRTVTLNASWHDFGEASPITVLSGKRLWMSFTVLGTAETDVHVSSVLEN